MSRYFSLRRGARIQLAMFLAASLVLLAIVIINTPALSDLVDLIWLKLKIILGI